MRVAFAVGSAVVAVAGVAAVVAGPASAQGPISTPAKVTVTGTTSSSITLAAPPGN